MVLNRASAAIAADARANIATSDLTEAEFAILEALHHKGPMLLGEVPKKILVSSGGTTFLIDKLEKRGLVQRAPCATDRRARYAELTPAGTKLVADIFPAHAEVIRRAMSGLGLADQRRHVWRRDSRSARASRPPVDRFTDSSDRFQPKQLIDFERSDQRAEQLVQEQPAPDPNEATSVPPIQ